MSTKLLYILYWSLVLPSTALSAWLLLSKPKLPKPTKGASMSDFKPLRRQLGLVMLLSACVVTAAWARSYLADDLLALPGSDVSLNSVRSFRGTVDWMTISPIDAEKISITQSERFDIATKLIIDSLSNFDGNAFFTESASESVRARSWKLSYSSIVIPLTFMSAYLHFGSPRVRAPVPENRAA